MHYRISLEYVIGYREVNRIKKQEHTKVEVKQHTTAALKHHLKVFFSS